MTTPDTGLTPQEIKEFNLVINHAKEKFRPQVEKKIEAFCLAFLNNHKPQTSFSLFGTDSYRPMKVLVQEFKNRGFKDDIRKSTFEMIGHVFKQKTKDSSAQARIDTIVTACKGTFEDSESLQLMEGLQNLDYSGYYAGEPTAWQRHLACLPDKRVVSPHNLMIERDNVTHHGGEYRMIYSGKYIELILTNGAANDAARQAAADIAKEPASAAAAAAPTL